MTEDEIKKERDFLHSILNKVAIAQGRLKLITLKSQAGNPLSEQKMLESVEKSLKSLDEFIALVNQHRKLILEDDGFIPDPEIKFEE